MFINYIIENKMSFSIVQTRKSFNSKPQLSIVPFSWLSKDFCEVIGLHSRKTWIWYQISLGRLSNAKLLEKNLKDIRTSWGWAFKTWACHRFRWCCAWESRRTPAMRKQMFSSKSYQMLPPKTSTNLCNEEISVIIFIVL